MINSFSHCCGVQILGNEYQPATYTYIPGSVKIFRKDFENYYKDMRRSGALSLVVVPHKNKLLRKEVESKGYQEVLITSEGTIFGLQKKVEE